MIPSYIKRQRNRLYLAAQIQQHHSQATPNGSNNSTPLLLLSLTLFPNAKSD